MLITKDEVVDIFSKLLAGKISREEVDSWACEKMYAFDYEELEFSPAEDEELLWSGVMYLMGIDLQTSPREYMYSFEEIEEVYREKWRDNL
ncbi:hypothetical protein WH95_01240 [Kiloniella litopenaei]|uniref:Uncharacterized protein n=1 Tax=Kiloniella litopenaei TaxID=1549748 RepID=A0A0M2RFD8_9PROT|nr:hypothetical protein [Kiloniella litopenaei]KKJ78730.1 hypothetical protein WH95_01240 [Kiloniella litopenaei]